ncbi:hypothetical protein C8J57DRAFT_1212201 [Mycena rebaudengoi]|nr:hypothetical protein C8J57DRAFT_1212201 [Mycena rebaudengoi]
MTKNDYLNKFRTRNISLEAEEVSAVEAPESLTAKEFWAAYKKDPSRQDSFVMDDTSYHQLSSIPPGYAEVDVKLNDNGKEFDCIMTTEMIGTKVSSSEDLSLSSTGKDDTKPKANQ